MAPRRNNNANHHHSSHHHSTGGVIVPPSPPSSTTTPTTATSVPASVFLDAQNFLGFGDLTLSNNSVDYQNNNLTIFNNNNNNNNNSSNNSISNNILNFDLHHNTAAMTNENNFTRCCVPIGECFKNNLSPDFGLIGLDDLSDCVRVICNNENCISGQYMHRECFESWEQSVLTALKTIGRARSWSDRQRQQNLWTKKGYDLVYKACGCKCGRGHLKKDLDWTPPPVNNNIFGKTDEEATKKKKKRNRNNQKPTLTISNINPVGFHPNSSAGGKLLVNTGNSNGNIGMDSMRSRARSLSSSSGGSSSSPPVSASSEHSSISPIHNANNMSIEDNNNNNKILVQQQPMSPPQLQLQQQQQDQLQQTFYQQHHHMQQMTLQQMQKSKVELYSERVRSTSGCNGIFSRRLDFSSFNQLPKTRLNSYQVKMEDEGNHGNDETRLFILSSLAQNQKSRVKCVLCEDAMLVFDRYPLVDGSFFLSPKQHAPGCIEVKYEGRSHYLTAVCMGCLDGTSCSRGISCRFCGERWNGSSLVLGTMYSYDIFAAMPCCAERLKCNACFKLLLHPEQRLNFYSDYSRCLTCHYCATQDTHFVKPLGHCYTKISNQIGIQLP